MATLKNEVSDPGELNDILVKLEKLHHIRDLSTLLDNILTETRALASADAGSIFLVENNRLKFSYVQNDTLFRNDFLASKYIYSNSEMAIDENSIAGFVATTGESLLIENAYKLDPDVPFSFNPYFDEISSYKTKSMLVVPLRTSKSDLVGVLELINRLDAQGDVLPFTSKQRAIVSQFAFYAGVAIERAILLRDVVYKMVRMMALRDPEETRPHVNRVGFYAVEIYKRWALVHDVPKAEIDQYKDILLMSAMLHDIGKVGIPDAILRKPGPLTDSEREFMKLHVIFGASYFEDPRSEWDTLAREISLNHHEKWDGSGYPGHITDLDIDSLPALPGKRGPEIPLSARIVAIADVYDALSSRRAYKEAWEEDRVLHKMREESGRHFDPELIDIFFEIYDVLRAIRQKWE
ncbi:MAG TPA: HD domain-containing phosphohydrolase [Rectinemataceae bacterium]|nr:HD domain-containing phosphohydrolase [Rectinemataceae bacterium]